MTVKGYGCHYFRVVAFSILRLFFFQKFREAFFQKFWMIFRKKCSVVISSVQYLYISATDSA